MVTMPQHSGGPENEYASDSSAIDPRDFRNALGTYVTGVTIITAAADQPMTFVGNPLT